jgi:hypothetical protein
MTALRNDPIQTWAKVAGFGYLAIIVLGMYAEFFVRGSLIVPGDAAATAAAIRGSGLFYRSALVAEFGMLVADVLVAVALWVVFRRISEGLALLAALFRVTHAAIVAVNLLAVWIPLLLLGDTGYVAALGGPQRESFALLLLEAHAYGYAVGLVFFGVYCLLLGHLIARSGYMPRIFAVLLTIAAAGYLADSLARTLLADYAAYASVFGTIVLVPAFVAELSFSLRLVIRGVDVPREAPA